MILLLIEDSVTFLAIWLIWDALFSERKEEEDDEALHHCSIIYLLFDKHVSSLILMLNIRQEGVSAFTSLILDYNWMEDNVDIDPSEVTGSVWFCYY